MGVNSEKERNPTILSHFMLLLIGIDSANLSQNMSTLFSVRFCGRIFVLHFEQPLICTRHRYL